MDFDFKALAALIPPLFADPKLAIFLAALVFLAYTTNAIRRSTRAGAFPLILLTSIAFCGVGFAAWFLLQLSG